MFNLHASSRSSPKKNHMLITRLTCIQESRHDSYPQFPWTIFGEDQRKKKKPAFLESHSAKASSTNNVTFDSKPKKALTHFLI